MAEIALLTDLLPESMLRFILHIPQLFAIALVRIYQKTISPMFPPTCRFTPSCSEYFIQAVRKYGLVVGSCKGFWRILRCNPWNPGGEDGVK